MSQFVYGIRVRIQGVADSSVTDPTLGIYNGDISWTWGSYAQYSEYEANSRILTAESLPSLVEGANISYGGVLGGLTDMDDLVVPNAGVVAAYLRGDIRLEGNVMYVIRGTQQTLQPRVLAMARIAGVAVTSASSMTVRMEPYLADNTPLQGVVISKDMCFGQDAKPVGEILYPTIGGTKALWGMKKIPMPKDMGSVHISHDPTSFYPETSWYINRDADPVMDLFGNEISQNPATGLIEGRGLLRIRFIQAGGMGGVWVNLTLDGRNDVFNYTAINDLYTSPVAATRDVAMRAILSWVGKELRVVGGAGQGQSYNVSRARWNNSDTSWAYGLWLYLAGAAEGDLTAWGATDATWTDEGPGPMPGTWGFTGQVGETLVEGPGSGDITFFTTNAAGSGASILALGQACDYYLVHGDIQGAFLSTVFAKAGDVFKEVTLPYGSLRIVNEGEGWKMLALDKGSLANAEWDSEELEAYLNGNVSWNPLVPSPVLAGHYMARIVEGGVYQGVEFGQENELVENISQMYAYETVAGNDTRISSRITMHIPEFGRKEAYGTSPSVLPFVIWNLGDTARFSDNASHTTSLSIDVYAYDSQQILLGSKHYAGEWIGGVNEVGVNLDNRTICGHEREYLKALEALDMRDILALDVSDRRFGGFIVQCRLETWTTALYGQVTELTCTAKAPRKFVRTPVDTETLYLQNPGNPASLIRSPLELAEKLTAMSGGLPVFLRNDVDTIQEGFYSDNPQDMCVIPEEGDTSTSLLADVCRQSLTALTPLHLGLLEDDTILSTMSATWFAGDGEGTVATVEITHADILPGSLVISKPDAGFLCSDFSFSTRSRVYDADTKGLKVNTGLTETFPSAAAVTRKAVAEEWQVIASGNERGPWVMVLRSKGTISPYSSLVAQLPLGQRIRLSSTDAVSAYYGEVTAIAPQLGVDAGQPNQITYLGIRITGVTIMDPEWAPGFDLIATVEAVSPGLTWQSCVSAEGGLTYLTARNMWNLAKDARDKLGYAKKAPSDTSTMTQPVWGSDPKALQNWAMATIQWQTKPKTAIRFRAPLSTKIHRLQLMNVVSISVGPYRNSPTRARIVELKHDNRTGVVEIAALSFLDDKDVLIINEQPAEAANTQYVESPGAQELDEGMV